MRPGIRWRVSCGHPKSRESATYVLCPGRSEQPDGKRRSNSEPGCGVRLRGARGSLADRIRGEEKIFWCVTTRRRNFGVLNGLGCGLGALTAVFLRLGMLGFDAGVLATFSLAASRLPAVDLPQAFGVLAVALVPAPRLVFASTSFAQAYPPAWSAPSGQTAVLCFNVRDAHGSCDSQGKSSGRMLVAFSSGAIKTRKRRLPASLSSSREPDRETNDLIDALGTRTQSAALQTIESAAESEIGPTYSETARYHCDTEEREPPLNHRGSP